MGKLTNRRKSGKSGPKRPPPLRLTPPSKRIEQFAREQGVKPIQSVAELDALGALFPEVNLDAFAAFIEESRANGRRSTRRKGK
jgi:hypothetical protein